MRPRLAKKQDYLSVACLPREVLNEQLTISAHDMASLSSTLIKLQPSFIVCRIGGQSVSAKQVARYFFLTILLRCFLAIASKK